MTHDHAIDLDELLELDGIALRDYLAELVDWVSRQAPDASRVLDLGAGTGTGTVALAQRFGTVVALDSSAQRLALIRAKSPGPVVTTVEADVDDGWPELEPVDLVWAANCVHEFADPDRVLKDVYATLRPGGLLALTEMDTLPRFLPDDLEVQWHQALGHQFGQDWAPRLTAAGFTISAARTFPIEAPSTSRYAQVYLGLIRHQLVERLSASSLAELDAVIAGIPARDDIVIRASRTTWLARRPA
jgi:trans-aconitate methyltransferase